jgi:chemotaxis protein CheD
MCHFMLPSRHGATAEEHDGRYADEAVALLLAAMRKHGCQPEEFQAKLFGGGQMFERLPMVVNVAQQNVTAARALMAGHEFKVIGEHVGGQGHRQIMLDLNCGKTWLQHRALP